ncbi:MAG TPA: signal recognition particle-docking protein FtsY [Candidatus Binataceae bacterium]|nr:signal recognition particle-docking protein FtsY [Candidatus Binataceae bacterium]
MSTLHLLMLIALIVQFPLAGLAFAVEVSQRKKRPRPSRVHPKALRAGEAARPVPEAAERPPYPVVQVPMAPALSVQPEQPAETAPTPAEATTEIIPSPPLEPSAPPEVEIPPLQAETAIEISPPPVTEPEEPVTEPGEMGVEPAPAIPEAVQTSEAARPAEIAAAPEPVPPPAVSAPPPMPEAPARQPVRIGLGLRKTRENFLARIRAAITGSDRLDEIYESLEEALIGADVGVETSTRIVAAVRSKLKNDARADLIKDSLKDEIARALIGIERPLSSSGDAPLVIMMAGVNGAGKTTTVAKLAALLKAERGSVVVAAADTFRAAAIEQLQIWCDRVGVELIKQKQGSDPAAVAFDAVKAANARKAGAVIIDTAGRLQTKVNLMEELKKIARVVSREIPGSPHEIWLVLDATTGQNAISQAKIFGDAVKLTGVVLAKLDSSAKGGVIVAIADRLKLPVRYVGLGEELDDLRPFDAKEFVEALFSESETSRDAASSTYAA